MALDATEQQVFSSSTIPSTGSTGSTGSTDSNNLPIIILSQNTLSVDESGTSSFSVSLDSQPSANVVLTMSSENTGSITIDPVTLTFTPENWNISHQVIVAGIDDFLVDGNQDETIMINATDSYGNSYDTNLVATIIDNDSAGITLSQNNISVDESGTSTSFSVKLNSQPESNVILNVNSEDNNEASVDKNTLLFTPLNWSNEQIVTVTGIDDDIADGEQTSLITLSSNSNDSSYASLPDKTLTTVTSDNGDTADVILSQNKVLIDESGTTTSFSVKLNSEPEDNVTLSVVSRDNSEASVDKSTLFFTSTNWQEEQIVTVMGIDDTIADGSQNTEITIGIDSNDLNYAALVDKSLMATTTDNEPNITYIVDTSGSMEQINQHLLNVEDKNNDSFDNELLDVAIAAAEQINQALVDKNIFVGSSSIIRLNDRSTTSINNSDITTKTSLADLHDTFSSLQYGSSINIESALDILVKQFDENENNHVVIISDGVFQTSETINQLTIQLSAKASVHAFGVGNSENLSQLDLLDDGISNNSANLFNFLQTANSIADLF